jgi:hypothetical protein
MSARTTARVMLTVKLWAWAAIVAGELEEKAMMAMVMAACGCRLCFDFKGKFCTPSQRRRGGEGGDDGLEGEQRAKGVLARGRKPETITATGVGAPESTWFLAGGKNLVVQGSER